LEPQPTNLTREELEELQDRLTMLDIYRARKTSVDAANRGLAAYHETAKRIGLVDEKTSLETFLSRIRAEDFNSVMAGAVEDPKSRVPSNGGETEPVSSDGTDTDLETSSS
jgi:hypothetical protein